ncbi:hypothetical protein [Pseudomonas sp. PS01303]|uniref:hypothetical protein n=1 Tax=Pseudomonas sp. PS01303 TaxID=2991439 RepID=UPI00249C63FB|nr:hypothetical protein [Pseudomonas sp. PS01303]
MVDELIPKKEDEVQYAPPTITSPPPSIMGVLPGARISANFFSASLIDRWSVEVWIKDKKIHLFEGPSWDTFSYRLPKSLIPTGTMFYFKVDYRMLGIWSKWAWSGDKLMVDERPVIMYPAAGSVVTENTSVSGTAYPGATVNLYQANVGDRIFGTAIADSNGHWVITPSIAFFSGHFSLTANQTFDRAVYDWATPVTFIVMSKPTISVPATGAVVSSHPVVAGRGIPDAIIELYQANSGTVLFGSARVNSAGYWEVIPDKPLFFGDFNLTVIQKINGVESEWADPVNFHVLGKPVITRPTAGDFVTGKPVVAGTAYPGAKIELYQANSGTVLFGTAITNSTGQWEVIPSTPFFDGDFNLTVIQKINDLESEWADPVPFHVLGKPVINRPTAGTVVTSKPVVAGTAYPGTKVELYQANSGTVLFATATTNSDGRWETIPSVPFFYGDFSLTAIQKIHGLESDWAEPVTLKVVAENIEVAPVIITPKSGAHVLNKPPVAGEGIPGAKVYFYNADTGGILSDSALVQENGLWDTRFTVALPFGLFNLKAKQTTPDGVSDWSNVASFYVEPL